MVFRHYGHLPGKNLCLTGEFEISVMNLKFDTRLVYEQGSLAVRGDAVN